MKTIWQNISVRRKISGLISLLTVAAVFVLTLILTQVEKNYFQRDLESQADLLLEATALSLRDPLYRMQLDELLDLAQALSDNANVTFFIVYDAEGKILVDSNSPDVLFSQSPDPIGLRLIGLQPGQIYREWRDDQFVSGRSVFIGNQNLGAIAAGLSTAALDRKIAEMTIESILLALVTVSGGTLLGLWLSNQITIPLSKLAFGAEQMSKGDRSVQIDAVSQDEIGQLARAFNVMVSAVQDREQELHDLAAGLERTVEERTAALREQAHLLEQMAITDPLVKVFNRRQFFVLAEKEIEKAIRSRRPLAIALFDADFFKQINDTYGHLAGDQALIFLAGLVQDNIRAADIFARYGGEEFVLLMPETDQPSAYAIADRLRMVVHETPCHHEDQWIPLSISIGVVCWDGGEDPSIEVLVSRADEAMYISKDKGRNAVTIWGE
jgi:diguanylate cyclase (GGDEF)-like protein